MVRTGGSGRHRRSVALAVLAMLVALAGVGAAGCSGSDATEGDVLVIGDSLTVGAEQQGLGEDQPAAWTIDAVEGRRTSAGVDVARDRDPSSFDAVIVALGTNDYTDSEAGFAAKVDDVMAAIGPEARVIWVNVDAGTSHLAPAADGVNPALAAAADRHPNLEVADWNAFVNARDDVESLRAGDGTHYGPDGYDVRARWMESLVAP